MNEIIKRLKSDTPVFFKRLRAIGITLGSIGGVIVAAPVALPAIIVTIGGYMIVGGSVIASVSQLTKKDTID
jgi:ABC-type xylose transport system permease subunit